MPDHQFVRPRFQDETSSFTTYRVANKWGSSGRDTPMILHGFSFGEIIIWTTFCGSFISLCLPSRHLMPDKAQSLCMCKETKVSSVGGNTAEERQKMPQDSAFPCYSCFLNPGVYMSAEITWSLIQVMAFLSKISDQGIYIAFHLTCIQSTTHAPRYSHRCMYSWCAYQCLHMSGRWLILPPSHSVAVALKVHL